MMGKNFSTMPSANVIRRSRITKYLCVTGVALVLSGCSSVSENRIPQSVGPLEAYMSQLRMSEDAFTAAAKSEHERAERLTAACMIKEGFDYTPKPFIGGPVFGGSMKINPHSEIGAEAEEFAHTYGYGIVENPDAEAASVVADEQMTELVDVNGDYRESLTESELDAYWLVLNGPPLSEEELRRAADGDTLDIAEGRGCAGAALDKARSERKDLADPREDPEFQDLFKAEDVMYEALNAEEPTHEDVIALNSSWSQCMTKHGHSIYWSPLNAQNTLGQEYDQNESDLSDLGETLSEAEKDRFQELEIEVASADLSCRKDVDYETELERITHELEQHFVDEHKSRLEALVLQYGVPQK